MFSFIRSKPAMPSYPVNTYDEKMAQRDVRLFLDSTKQVADDILGPSDNYRNGHIHPYECVGRVKTRHFWMWWPMTPIYVDPYPYRYPYPGRVHTTQDPDQALRFVVGIAAAILGGYAIFKVSEGLGRCREASEELKENWEFKSKLRVIQHLFPRFSHLDEINQIAEIKQRIFSRIKSDATYNLALMVSLVAASTLVLVGAVAASGGLMLAGISVGAGTGVFLLCRKGFGGIAHRQIHDARLIRNHLAVLNS